MIPMSFWCRDQAWDYVPMIELFKLVGMVWGRRMFEAPREPREPREPMMSWCRVHIQLHSAQPQVSIAIALLSQNQGFEHVAYLGPC